MKVRKSTIGDYAGRGLFAARDIPANTHFFTRENVNSFYVLPLTWYIITSMRELADAHRLHFVDMQLSTVEVFISGRSSATFVDNGLFFAEYSSPIYRCIWILLCQGYGFIGTLLVGEPIP